MDANYPFQSGFAKYNLVRKFDAFFNELNTFCGNEIQSMAGSW